MSEIHGAINEGRMSGFQKQAVAICIGLNMLDGFDVLVMAFTASSVSAEWRLSGADLGLLLSSGLFGMAGGSLFLAPFADRYGRRSLTLLCLALITTGMLLSSVAGGSGELLLYRVLTGLGIGGMLASLSVITSEYSSNRWRSTNISLSATGYPVGATIGGSIAAVLLANYGWRSVFVFGALTSALMIPVVAWRLPESLDFLLAKRPANALRQLNALLRRMHRPEIAALPDPVASSHRHPTSMSRLFSGELLRSTLLIWASFFLLMFSFYFVMSWTPKLLVTAGLSAQEGVTGGVLLNLGGIAGGTLFGLLAARFRLRSLVLRFLGLTAGLLVVFGLLASRLTLTLAFPAAIGTGIFLFGSMVGLYSMTPILYPAEVRTTGMGWAIGVGRIGAILSPAIVGLLVDGGWQTSHLYYAFAVPLVVAALTVRALKL
jgi:benzoate transport